MPFASDVRGCFCCGPSQSFPRNSHLAMQGPPFSLNLTASGPGPVLSHSMAPANDPMALGPVFEQIDISGAASNAMLSSLDIPQTDNALSSVVRPSQEMCEHEDDEQVFVSPSGPQIEQVAIGNNLGQFSFRFLQDRQLGCKVPSGNGVPGDIKPLLSSSAPGETILSRNFDRRLGRGNGAGECSSEGGDMDLDSALDELGMLSTITNSRKQYLLETRSQASIKKREQRLRTKSESSPNLSNLGRPNGYCILQVDTTYVTGMSSTPSPAGLVSSVHNSTDGMPIKSHPFRADCWRDPEVLENSAAARRRRSVPRMSRMRKDRYRRSRCPYKIPNRLCSSMQESDFGPDYFDSCTSPFSSPSIPSEPGVDALSHRLADAQLGSQSKSNTASPVKPVQEVRLVRSISAENLLPVRRRLERDLDLQRQESSRADESLDVMASQLTNLHMS
ncbi:uncharacterized protein LOC101855482 [Aplysia californica]|uniref:Uncharacterized protein LOC101855482 n=1 Tax=Aplysia californica TaxID=6500 RepID=A0ABM0JKQ2_APLCA|nr:uncharacterized protein LOC101855482 [Aplysia californica]